MKTRLSSPAWVGFMCGAVGVGVGVLVGVAIGGNISAPWLGGAAGVVAAIIAVSNFIWSVTAKNEDRAIEQRNRDEDAAAAVDRAAKEVEMQHAREIAEAGQILIRLRGGGGFGQGSEFRMTSLNFDLLNGTTKPISQITVDLQPTVPFKREGDEAPSILGPGQQVHWLQQTEAFVTPANEASGNAMSHHQPVVTYSLDGRRWRRLGENPPELVGN